MDDDSDARFRTPARSIEEYYESKSNSPISASPSRFFNSPLRYKLLQTPTAKYDREINESSTSLESSNGILKTQDPRGDVNFLNFAGSLSPLMNVDTSTTSQSNNLDSSSIPLHIAYSSPFSLNAPIQSNSHYIEDSPYVINSSVILSQGKKISTPFIQRLDFDSSNYRQSYYSFPLTSPSSSVIITPNNSRRSLLSVTKTMKIKIPTVGESCNGRDLQNINANIKSPIGTLKADVERKQRIKEEKLVHGKSVEKRILHTNTKEKSTNKENQNINIPSNRKSQDTSTVRAIPSATTTSNCNCKKSRCLKLYCECFAAGRLCDGCNCIDCANSHIETNTRENAIKATLERNPLAFHPKIATPTSASDLVHQTGCNCKKSKCLKRYCECYHAGIQCSDKCKCLDCKNCKRNEDSPLETSKNRNSSLLKRDISRSNIKKADNHVVKSLSFGSSSTLSPSPSKSSTKENTRTPLLQAFGNRFPPVKKAIGIEILNYLDNDDLYNASLVNSLWNTMALDETIWEY